jgi:hypothetical protein
MHAKAPIESRGSPVPGIAPEPVPVHGTAPPPHDDGDQHEQTDVGVRRRDPASLVLAKVLSVIRGDKYMVDAYEPDWSALKARRAAATVVGVKHDGERAHIQRHMVLDNPAASPPQER